MACLYPQTILLDNSLESNKKLAFAILIGCIDADLTKNTMSNVEWGNINMDFQYNKKNSLNLDFERINYHYTIRDKTYNNSEQILNITKFSLDFLASRINSLCPWCRLPIEGIKLIFF